MTGYENAKMIFRDAVDWTERMRIDENIFASTHDKAIGRDLQGFRAGLRKMVPSGIYEHFKSSEGDPKFYAVSGVTFDVTTPGKLSPPMVVYASLYGNEAGNSASRYLVHAEDGFLCPILNRKHKGSVYTGPRFKLHRRLPTWAVELLARKFRKKGVIRRFGTRQDYIDSVCGMTVLADPEFDFEPHVLF